MNRSTFPFFACNFTEVTGFSVGVVQTNAIVLLSTYIEYGTYSLDILA